MNEMEKENQTSKEGSESHMSTAGSGRNEKKMHNYRNYSQRKTDKIRNENQTPS